MDSKGQLTEQLGKWILMIIVLMVILIIIGLLRGNMSNQWEALKNLLSFGGG